MKTGKYARFFICFLAVLAWIGLAQAQEAKTVKLSNGEEVLDISGEWEVKMENYGRWTPQGNYYNIDKITLEGDTFVGVRMKHDAYHTKGHEDIRCELDKDGIKKVQIMGYVLPIEAKGQISEDGNQIIIDDGEKTRRILTRK